MAFASRRGGAWPALRFILELAPVFLPQTGDDSHHAQAEQPHPQPLSVTSDDMEKYYESRRRTVSSMGSHVDGVSDTCNNNMEPSRRRPPSHKTSMLYEKV